MLLLPSVLPGVMYSEEPGSIKVPLNDAVISIGWHYERNFSELGTLLGARAIYIVYPFSPQQGV